jgi:lipoprotein-releasing system permease protein
MGGEIAGVTMREPGKYVSGFLALRYLRPKRSFVSIITIISVLGVLLGVGILTGAVAIMTGHGEKIRKNVLGFEPHLTIQFEPHLNAEQGGVLYHWPEVVKKVQQNPAVIAAVPYSFGQVAMDYDHRLEVISLQGLEPEPGPLLERLERLLARDSKGAPRGQFDLSGNNVVVGKALAEHMDMKVGDSIVLYSLANGRQLLDAQRTGKKPSELIFPVELKVVGIFDSGRHLYDREVVFVPLEIGQRLYNLSTGAHGVAVLVKDPYAAGKVRDELAKVVPEPLTVITWMERNRQEFEMVSTERVVIYTILFVIMVVAGFSISNTMITITTQKRREIGLIKAMGARSDQIVRIFMIQGLIVGLLGVIAGLSSAMLFLVVRQDALELLRRVLGMEIFSAEIYDLYKLPARITMVDLTVISASALLACGFASLFPAYLAARMDAAKALRNESSG